MWMSFGRICYTREGTCGLFAFYSSHWELKIELE